MVSLMSTATRYFMAVAEAGSVHAAAQQLHVAASAVSRQVAKLEDGLGCALFERQPRGMALSEAGQRLAAWVRRHEDDATRLLDSLHELDAQRRLRVRLACTEGFSTGFLPQQMARFRRLHPGARIHLQVGSPDEVSQWLLRGEVDLGLKYCMAPERGLTVLHLRPAPILALVAPGHPLAGQGPLSLADVVAHPVALPDPGTTVRQAFDLACSQRGLHYDLAFTGNFAALLALVAEGEVLSFAGALSAAHAVAAGSVCAVPVLDTVLQERSLQVLCPAHQRLSDTVLAYAQDLAQAMG